MDSEFIHGLSKDNLDKLDDWLEIIKGYVWQALSGEQVETNLNNLYFILDKTHRDVRHEYRKPMPDYGIPQIAMAAGGRSKRKSRKRARKSKK